MAAELPAGVQAWFDRLDVPARRRAEDLAEVVAGADRRLERDVKWSRVTFTVGGNWHHWLCAIAAPRKGVKLVFHKGALLDDPERLLTGTGRYLREISAEDATRRPDAVHALVRDAIAHQTQMLDAR